MSMWEAFTISFILILLQKMLCVIKPCHWPWIKFFSSGGHKSWHHSRLVAATFHFTGLPRSLQDTVRTRRALVLCFLIKHVFCFTLLTLQCDCVPYVRQVMSPVPWWLIMNEVSPQRQALYGVYTDLPVPRDSQGLCEGRNQMWAKCVGQIFLS